MGLLSKAYSARYDGKPDSLGKAVLVTTEASKDLPREVELYHPPGLVSAPTKEDRIVETRVGAYGRVAVATHNYRLDDQAKIEGDGETLLYSTDKEGNDIKSSVRMKTDGTIEVKGPKASITIKIDGTVEITSKEIHLKGSGKTLVTHGELKKELDGFVAAINTELASIATSTGGGTQKGGSLNKPYTTKGVSLNIDSANAVNLKTDG